MIMGCQAPTGWPRAWPVRAWTSFWEWPPQQGRARLWLNEEMPRRRREGCGGCRGPEQAGQARAGCVLGTYCVLSTWPGSHTNVLASRCVRPHQHAAGLESRGSVAWWLQTPALHSHFGLILPSSTALSPRLGHAPVSVSPLSEGLGSVPSQEVFSCIQ